MKRTDRWHSVKGKGKSRTLTAPEFKDLQELWSEQNTDYGTLASRFTDDQKNHRRHGRRNYLVGNIAEWRPKRKLSAEEQNWISMQPVVKVHTNLVLTVLI